MAGHASSTLSDLARRLEVPQHRLIHLVEKGVVTPDIQEAAGRGSSRVFSQRNFLEFAVALRLREMLVPVSRVGALFQVLRAFESKLQAEIPEFRLPEGLRDDGAPDLRIIVSDGSTVFFSLGRDGGDPKLFGGISFDLIAEAGPPTARNIRATTASRTASTQRESRGFGGPEGSRFIRLELSVTEVARALPL